ncbi:hypothetical protein NQZ68_009937 [Dissostichus eleginoides]|nr:hypothetical protein NQZ68_009937 [Dissostichus eleginoides]
MHLCSGPWNWPSLHLICVTGVRTKPRGGDDVTKEYHVITGKMALPGVQSKPSCSNPNEDLLQSRHVGLKRTTDHWGGPRTTTLFNDVILQQVLNLSAYLLPFLVR